MSVVKPVVVLGIFNADAVYRAERQPKIGETVMGEKFKLEAGGKGSNQAVSAARASGETGPEVHFISRLGADDFAKMARKIWSETGIIADVTEDPETHTGSAFIFIEAATGNNAIIVCPGAAGKMTAADLEARADLIGSASVFVTQLETPVESVRAGLAIARKAGVKTILNPAPARALDDELLALCDYLTPNESEAELLTGIAVTDRAGAEAAADALMARGVGAVVVTLGENGVLYRDQSRTIHVPVARAGAVAETTGAGDSFNGAFAVALAEGKPVEEALRFANAAAGISVTRPGASDSMASRAEIDALLARG